MDCACKNIDKIAIKLDKSEVDIKSAFDNAMTIVDHHEWFTKVASELGQENDYLWITLSKGWIMANKESDAVKGFFSKLEKAINQFD